MNTHSISIAEYLCASCGELNEIDIDPSGGAHQTYTEDCQICCRPNVLHITINEETGQVWVESEFEG